MGVRVVPGEYIRLGGSIQSQRGSRGRGLLHNRVGDNYKLRMAGSFSFFGRGGTGGETGAEASEGVGELQVSLGDVGHLPDDDVGALVLAQRGLHLRRPVGLAVLRLVVLPVACGGESERARDMLGCVQTAGESDLSQSPSQI